MYEKLEVFEKIREYFIQNYPQRPSSLIESIEMCNEVMNRLERDDFSKLERKLMKIAFGYLYETFLSLQDLERHINSLTDLEARILYWRVLHWVATGQRQTHIILESYEQIQIEQVVKKLIDAKLISGRSKFVSLKEARILNETLRDVINDERAKFLPMLLIITNKQKLQGACQNNPDSISLLESAVSDFGNALKTDGIHIELVYLDDVIGGFNLLSDWEQQEEIRKYFGAWYQYSRMVNERAYLLILGNDEIVPFYRVVDPDYPSVRDDYIYSDDPYVASSSDLEYRYDVTERYIPPNIPVGRMPNSAYGNIDLILTQLKNAASFHRKPPTDLIAKTSAGGFYAKTWQEASKVIYRELEPQLKNLLPCPYYGLKLKEIKSEHLEHRQFLYFNVHGKRDEIFWRGDFRDADGSPYYPCMLAPYLVGLADVKNAAVFSEACDSAYILNKRTEDSIALTFMDRGALCFIGATARSWGSPGPKLTFADVLAKEFFVCIKQPNVSVGRALLSAKQNYGQTDGWHRRSRKTLLEFVLYGDPTAKPLWNRGGDI
jgi:hypothetical protein